LARSDWSLPDESVEATYVKALMKFSVGWNDALPDVLGIQVTRRDTIIAHAKESGRGPYVSKVALRAPLRRGSLLGHSEKPADHPQHEHEHDTEGHHSPRGGDGHLSPL
jgi:hypothetical protein